MRTDDLRRIIDRAKASAEYARDQPHGNRIVYEHCRNVVDDLIGALKLLDAPQTQANDRRERIAIAAMQSILACETLVEHVNAKSEHKGSAYPLVSRMAVKHADALIAELDGKA